MLGQSGAPSRNLKLKVASECGIPRPFQHVAGAASRQLSSRNLGSLDGERRRAVSIASQKRDSALRRQNVTFKAASESANPVVNIWASYTRRIETDPVPTKALTSFLGFVIGDFLAQKIEGVPYDIFRAVRLGTYGLFLDGPIGHWWYTVLDKYVEPGDPRSTKAVLLKTAADQLVWAPVMTCVFFAVLKALEGHPELIIPTIQANYVIWPAAHFINFRFVPTEQRILYNNVVSVAWTAYLSTLSAVPLVDVDDIGNKLLETQTQIFDSLPYGLQDGATQAANRAWEQLKNLPSFDSLLAPGQHYGLDLTIPKKIAIRPPRMVPALLQSLFSGGNSSMS